MFSSFEQSVSKQVTALLCIDNRKHLIYAVSNLVHYKQPTENEAAWTLHYTIHIFNSILNYFKYVV